MAALPCPTHGMPIAPALAWHFVDGAWYLGAACPADRCGAWIGYVPKSHEWTRMAPPRKEAASV